MHHAHDSFRVCDIGADTHRIVRARWIDGDAVRDRRFFLCGVGAGVIALRDLLRGAGYERRAVRYEQW